MPPEEVDRLAHIRDCCARILRYTAGLDENSFHQQEMVVDAVVRNIEIIGEASKHVAPSVKALMPHIEWKNRIGMRSWIAHGYDRLDPDAVWEVVATKIPERLRTLQAFKDEHQS